jgi:cell wall-associated NlpC family hydrolase
MEELKKRLPACRPDLADERLRGRVEAKRFVAGKAMEIVAPVASMRREPSATAMQTTQALLGEKISVFESHNGWLWCQLRRDSYVGYIRAEFASDAQSRSTHRVATLSTLLYPAPDLKSQPAVSVPLNAAIEIVEAGEKFSRLSNGTYVFSQHVKSIDDYEPDFVSIAEKFLGVPYYWGGKTHQGLDCSGLLQISLEACGIASLRDSDLQEEQLGQPLIASGLSSLRRGDLVFWDGHVGVMTDDKHLLHANAHHMMTVEEPLADAVQRIAATGSQITSMKRL